MNLMTSKYNILQTVNTCDYPINYRDYVSNMIHEVILTSKSAKFYKMLKNGKNLAAVKYNIPTTFKAKTFDVPVFIYFPPGMPFEPPEVYLDKSSDTGVNPKNTDIDTVTCKITTYGLRNWQTNFNMQNIINEVIGSFNKNFPIYKLTSSKDSVNTSANSGNFMNTSNVSGNQAYNPTNFNNANYNNNAKPQTSTFDYTAYTKSNTGSFYADNNITNPNLGNKNFNSMNNVQTNQNVNIAAPIASVNTGTYGNYNNTNYNAGNYNNFNNYNNVVAQPNAYSNAVPQQNTHTNTAYNANSGYNNNENNKNQEELIKRILINEVKASLESKIRENIKRHHQQEEKLNNFKSQFNTQIEKYQRFTAKKDENISYFLDLVKKMDIDINTTQIYISDVKDRIFDSNNFMEFIIVPETNIINIICAEAAIEDIVAVAKKGFEKNIISFAECVRFIRSITREAIKVKMYREKILHNQN